MQTRHIIVFGEVRIAFGKTFQAKTAISVLETSPPVSILTYETVGFSPDANLISRGSMTSAADRPSSAIHSRQSLLLLSAR